MKSRNAQTHAKRARELAVQEKRERKRAKKAEAAAQRTAGGDESPGDDTVVSPEAGAPEEPGETRPDEPAS